MKNSARFLVWSAILGLSTALGCSGTDSGGSTQPSSQCAAYIGALCSREQSCYPYDFSRSFASVTDCANQRIRACSDLSLPGVTVTDAALASCASAAAAATCDALSGDLCAITPGTLAVGTPCRSDLQCVSGQCRSTSGACGTCVATAAAGQSCDLTTSTGLSCAPGLECVHELCAARSTAGQPCDKTTGNGCVAGLICLGGACASPVVSGGDCSSAPGPFCAFGSACINGSCAPRIAVGASCAASGEQSACVDGAYCDAISHTCKAHAAAAMGAACGANSATGEYVQCGYGLFCDTSGATGAGVCRADAALGETCGSSATGTSYVSCAGGLICVSGKCVDPSVILCNGAGGAGAGGSGSTGAGGSGAGTLGPDCLALKACCDAGSPSDSSVQSCETSLASYAMAEAQDPASAASYESSCKSALPSFQSVCSGGAGAGGSSGGTNSADSLAQSLGSPSGCDACLRAMSGFDSGGSYDCGQVVSTCDSDSTCSPAIQCFSTDRQQSPAEPVSCFVEGCVGTSNGANGLVVCASDKCRASCGLDVSVSSTDPQCQ